MFQLQPKLIAILTAIGLVLVAGVYLIAGSQINGLPEKSQESSHASGSALAAYAVGPVANFHALDVPAPVADLAFQDGDGKARHLSEFKGKVVLLNLWATWCVPCREEMPALDGLEAAAGSDKFQIVAVSVDKDGLNEARDFLKSVNASHIALFNDPTSSANFKIKGYGLPTTLLLSSEGMELGRIVGPAAWNTDEAKALIAAAVKLSER